MNKSEILKLQPAKLWEYFYRLTQIPRPSKHEEGVIEFLLSEAKLLNLEAIKDEVGNVIIRKSASPGCENVKGIIMQAHMDMVPQKNSGKTHDFAKDPLTTFVENGWVTADGTTLGADNGIGLAAGLAVMASDVTPHGPLELLATVNEESGMEGAFSLRGGLLNGEILLNLDSEDEGELYVGCAGGTNVNVLFNIEKEQPDVDEFRYVRISLTGLKGGHSGLDIDKGRGNANKLMFRFLWHLQSTLGIRLMEVDCGNMRNAIPREAFVSAAIPVMNFDMFKDAISIYQRVFLDELKYSEPDLYISYDELDEGGLIWNEEVQSQIIASIIGCSNGVVRMSDEVEGMVETSSNLSIIKSDDDKVTIKFLVRSSVDSAKEDVCLSLKAVFNLAGGVVSFDGQYPGWKPNKKSEILKVMQSLYKEQYSVEPKVKAIHAGLECGILGRSYPHWDMISFGPTIRYPHSPDEKVNIETVTKFWDFLCSTIQEVGKRS